MNRALRLVRDDEVLDEREEAVAAIDALINAPAPLAGELEERPNWAAPGWTLFRLIRGDGAPEATAHVATGSLSPRVRAKLYDFMRAVEDENGRPRPSVDLHRDA